MTERVFADNKQLDDRKSIIEAFGKVCPMMLRFDLPL
jgi:hypothetical protein